MTKQIWLVDEVTSKEVAKHLKDEHSVPFKDNAALTEDEFIEEHFPSLKNLLNSPNKLSETGIEKIQKASSLVRNALKFCEKHGIPIARVLDQDKKGDFFWRICKPTQKQVDTLKNGHWFPGAEGYFNKAVLQQAMINDEVDVDRMMTDLREQIAGKQLEREKQKNEEIQRETERLAAIEQAKAEKDKKEQTKGLTEFGKLETKETKARIKKFGKIGKQGKIGKFRRSKAFHVRW